MGTIFLYHTGFERILSPDIQFGRKNADFGQGFYLTEDSDFAHRWAKERIGMETIVNTYALNTTGLRIQRFDRNREWFDYIFANRSGKPDTIDADVIMGPISNDTIYDTFGIITSGYLKPEDALKLLLIGPEYRQTALKTEKAAAQLNWLSAEILEKEQLKLYRETVSKEEAAYQLEFAGLLEQITNQQS